MPKTLRIIIAQLKLLVGDLDANLEKHIQAAEKARDLYKADLIIFPELSLTGYPPEDLLLRKSFIEATQQRLQQLKETVTGIYCLVGHPHPSEQGLENACSLLYNGTIIGRYAKQHLVNYGVFDEARYFIPGQKSAVVPVQGISLGLVICEDLWHKGPVQEAVKQGAQVILCPNASPFEEDKQERRVALLTQRAKDHQVPIVYVNQVGGQDELIFDGGSMVVDAEGALRQLAGFFREVLHPVDLHFKDSESHIKTLPYQIPNEDEKCYKALLLGLKDYVTNNHFPGVLLGLSGGIDSALCLALAVDALGAERVEAVFMPSRYTSELSREEAQLISQHLKVSLRELSIEPIYQSFLNTLSEAFSGKKPDLTEENLQARCRGTLLMALSNKSGNLVLSTGNRSELAVGYATLYGDMAGGFAPLKDLPKTLVYRLSTYRNKLSPVIPLRTLTREPTAELALNQKDQDSLPPYPLLDAILDALLNKELGIEEALASGFDRDTVIRVAELVKRNEYKRYQAAPGPRLHHKAFGKDRRYPLSSGFKG